MITAPVSLKARAAAGLVTRHRAGRRDWYLARHAARHIRDARRYPASAPSLEVGLLNA